MNDANLTSGVYFSKENDAIKSYFKRIITFSSLDNPHYSLQANGYLLNLVSILSLKDTQDYNSAYPNFIIEAIKYINFNWQKNINLPRLLIKIRSNKNMFRLLKISSVSETYNGTASIGMTA